MAFVFLRASNEVSINIISASLNTSKKGEVSRVCGKQSKGFRALEQVVQVRCGGSAIYLNVIRWATFQDYIFRDHFYSLLLEKFL